MRALGKSKLIAVILLIFSMLIFPIATLERSIPSATYDIIYGDEINESESVEITSTPYAPVSSVVLFNESVMSSDSSWDKLRDFRFNESRFSKIVTLPYLNVSLVTFKLSAYVVIGPLDIFLWYYPIKSQNTTADSGEYCEIVTQSTPDEYLERADVAGLLWISIYFAGLNWSVIDQLYFSIQVEFTVSQCPLMIDLQRTNGESLYDLKEFEFIFQEDSRPAIYFDDHRILICQKNDTIFLPNGIYSLTFRWRGYNYAFNDVTILNETLNLEVRIKSVRLDVESLQGIPGLSISVGERYYSYEDELYSRELLTKDSPSFYLSSGNPERISVKGNPQYTYFPYHFAFNLDVGINRNITLIINENWILLGNLAFTPGRLAMLIAAVLVIVLTILLSKKEIAKSTVSGPFILLFLGSILPTYTERISSEYPITFPLNVFYTRAYNSISSLSTTASSYPNSVVAVSTSFNNYINPGGPLLLGLLFIVFLGVLLEILKEHHKLGSPDFLVAISILCYMIIQWMLVIAMLRPSSTQSVVFGVGPLVTVGAFLLWIFLFRRTGKTVFTSTS